VTEDLDILAFLAPPTAAGIYVSENAEETT
jgi:hypothetical protein